MVVIITVEKKPKSQLESCFWYYKCMGPTLWASTKFKIQRGPTVISQRQPCDKSNKIFNGRHQKRHPDPAIHN